MSPARVSAHLASHPWLAEAHAGSSGALLLLNPSGHAALRRHGRDALLVDLQNHLGKQASDPAYKLRLLDAAPGEQLSLPAIDRRLDLARPDMAIVLAEHEHDEHWTLTLQLPLELVHFDDHFQRAPVLPGVGAWVFRPSARYSHSAAPPAVSRPRMML